MVVGSCTSTVIVFMPALWDNLSTLVQRLALVCSDDRKLLRQAQLTHFACVAVGLPWIDHFMVYSTLLSLSDHIYFDSVVLYVWATVSVLLVSDGPLVVLETLLEWHGSKSSVLLFIVGLHECFVHKRSCMASTIQWATILLSSPASRIRWVFWSLLSITEDLVSVPFDDCSHVWHTTIAQHQSVPVEYCVQLRVLWEVLACLRPKPSANVDGYLTAVG